MLRAFAEAAAYLGRDDYRAIAEANAEFILSTLWDGQRLLHSFKDGRARFTTHTAFEDPTSTPDAAARESIEVRALIFWPEQDRN